MVAHELKKSEFTPILDGNSCKAADGFLRLGGHGHIRFASTKEVEVSTADLISVSETANTAFGGFDWEEHEGKGVRLFVQGFG